MLGAAIMRVDRATVDKNAVRIEMISVAYNTHGWRWCGTDINHIALLPWVHGQAALLPVGEQILARVSLLVPGVGVVVIIRASVQHLGGHVERFVQALPPTVELRRGIASVYDVALASDTEHVLAAALGRVVEYQVSHAVAIPLRRERVAVGARGRVFRRDVPPLAAQQVFAPRQPPLS